MTSTAELVRQPDCFDPEWLSTRDDPLATPEAGRFLDIYFACRTSDQPGSEPAWLPGALARATDTTAFGHNEAVKAIKALDRRKAQSTEPQTAPPEVLSVAPDSQTEPNRRHAPKPPALRRLGRHILGLLETTLDRALVPAQVVLGPAVVAFCIAFQAFSPAPAEGIPAYAPAIATLSTQNGNFATQNYRSI